MRNYIIDTDTGSDDAVALIMALRDYTCNVKAVTVVSGNVPLSVGTRAALISIEQAGVKNLPPVYMGMDRPFVKEKVHVTAHGLDGLGDQGYPDPILQPEKEHAVDAILRIVEECSAQNEDIDIIALGPLTNIAAAMIKGPDTMQKVSNIYTMGAVQLGFAALGSRTAVAFNMGCDPEASNLVYTFGVPMVMIPHELGCGETNGIQAEAELTMEDVEKIKTIGTPLAEFCVDCNRTFMNCLKQTLGREVLTMPDEITVAAALRPGLVRRSYRANVCVDTSGSETYGQTIVSRKPPYNTTIYSVLDGRGFKQYLYDMIKGGDWL